MIFLLLPLRLNLGASTPAPEEETLPSRWLFPLTKSRRLALLELVRRKRRI